MATIEIWDGPGVHFADLLAQVPDVEGLSWTAMELWAVGRDDDFDVGALERQAAESATGLAMSGSELRQRAVQLIQLVDGVIVGFRGRTPRRSDADLRDTAEVVIEAIDSTLWRVFARDDAIIGRLRRNYRDVRDVVPENMIRAVHETS